MVYRSDSRHLQRRSDQRQQPDKSDTSDSPSGDTNKNGAPTRVSLIVSNRPPLFKTAHVDSNRVLSDIAKDHEFSIRSKIRNMNWLTCLTVFDETPGATVRLAAVELHPGGISTGLFQTVLSAIRRSRFSRDVPTRARCRRGRAPFRWAAQPRLRSRWRSRRGPVRRPRPAASSRPAC